MNAESWKKIISTLSHHAYGIVCDIDTVHIELLEILQQFSAIPLALNPDVFHRRMELVSIDDARLMRERVLGTSTMGGKKFFIIRTQAFSSEAQNALLKILEEPVGNTHFFILVPTSAVLFPTVLSRLMMIEIPRTTVREGEKEAKIFLAARLPERMTFVKKMIDDLKEGRIFKSYIYAFMQSLELEVARNLGVSRSTHVLEALIHAERDLGLSGSSHKILLEHLAVVLPVGSS